MRKVKICACRRELVHQTGRPLPNVSVDNEKGECPIETRGDKGEKGDKGDRDA